MRAGTDKLRLLVPPFGKLTKWRFVTVQPADPQPFLTLNRYPKQVIGITLRLPDGSSSNDRKPHYGLSIRWATPARWWK